MKDPAKDDWTKIIESCRFWDTLLEMTKEDPNLTIIWTSGIREEKEMNNLPETYKPMVIIEQEEKDRHATRTYVIRFFDIHINYQHMIKFASDCTFNSLEESLEFAPTLKDVLHYERITIRELPTRKDIYQWDKCRSLWRLL